MSIPGLTTTLVIFSGLPGTGKTTLADRLARELRFPVLRVDDLTARMPAKWRTHDIAFWDTLVAMLLHLAEEQLKLDVSVIVDSVFMGPDRDQAQSIARKYAARFRPVYTFLSDESLWKQRVEVRCAALEDPRVANWDQIGRQRSHFRRWEPGSALFLDAVSSLDQNYSTLLDFITDPESSLAPLPEGSWVEGRYHD